MRERPEVERVLFRLASMKRALVEAGVPPAEVRAFERAILREQL